MKSDGESVSSKRERRRFVLRKLHSLAGVVPLGLFLVLHLFTNAQGVSGEATYARRVDELRSIPLLPLFEALVVLAPLAFHAIYGVALSLESRPNVGRYPFNRNWMYVAQRVTGILALAFIGWHLSQYWYETLRGRLAPEQYYGALCRDLSTPTRGVPLIALAYVFGVGATVFHFANGLYGFAFSWGIAVSKRAQRWSATAFGIVGAILFLVGANTAIYFATGSRIALFAPPIEAPLAGERTCADLPPDGRPVNASGITPAPPVVAPGKGPSPVKGR